MFLGSQPTEGGLGHGTRACGQSCQLWVLASEPCLLRDLWGWGRNVPTTAGSTGAPARWVAFVFIYLFKLFLFELQT